MKINPYIFSFLLFISFVVVGMPVIPHHHCAGIICMKDDTKEAESPHHHTNDDSCCTSDCITQLESSSAFMQPLYKTQPQFSYSIILFTEPLLRFITRCGEITVHRDYIYLESLHGISIAYAVGLRAPPSSFTI
jgi:hypothetical protein